MKHHVNFTPGPSQLYFTVTDHAREAFRIGIPSISHRSKQFEELYSSTTAGLRQLLSIPGDFHIFFTSSATEIWERLIQNCVATDCFHLVNGSFSRRFYEIARQLQKRAAKLEVAEGSGFDNVQVPQGAEFIGIVQNETSTGVSLPDAVLESLRKNNPDSIIAVDAVSSLPYPSFDFSKLDSLFLSVQKGFGLPAGLGVWIVNERCITKSEELLKNGVAIGTYHNLPTLKAHALKNQTPETPNVLAIFLLNRVVEDFLRRGIETIRRETEYKAVILYQALSHHRLIRPFVSEKKFQSPTVIVADCGEYTAGLSAHLRARGLMPGAGYGAQKDKQLRFANFPAHSKEQFELLVDELGAFPT